MPHAVAPFALMGCRKSGRKMDLCSLSRYTWTDKAKGNRAHWECALTSGASARFRNHRLLGVDSHAAPQGLSGIAITKRIGEDKRLKDGNANQRPVLGVPQLKATTSTSDLLDFCDVPPQSKI
jgi:hypothetical protein